MSSKTHKKLDYKTINQLFRLLDSVEAAEVVLTSDTWEIIARFYIGLDPWGIVRIPFNVETRSLNEETVRNTKSIVDSVEELTGENNVFLSRTQWITEFAETQIPFPQEDLDRVSSQWETELNLSFERIQEQIFSSDTSNNSMISLKSFLLEAESRFKKAEISLTKEVIK